MPPTHPLNPINPDNARILRITAAAGTELADAYSYGTVITLLVKLIPPYKRGLQPIGQVIPHATWLVQAYAH